MNNSSTVSLDNITNIDNLSVIFEFPEPYDSIRRVVNWATIGLVLMSIIGNTLIIVVMSQKQNRKSSTSLLFTCLAVSDMLLAFSVPFERWLHWTFGISLYGISAQLTTTKTVLTYSNIQMSSWLLVCITAERVLSIAFPYKIKELCTRQRAGTVVCFILIVILSLNSCAFNFIVSVTFDDAYGIIWVSKVDNGGKVIAWIDFTVSFFIPILCIICGSVYIIVHLLRISIQKHDSKNSRNRSVTMTLLAANIVFVVTMSPFVLLHLIYPSVGDVKSSIYLFWTMSELFMFTSDMNAALNFFVYVLSGSRFRSDVKQLFGLRHVDIAHSPSVYRKRLIHAVNALTTFRKQTHRIEVQCQTSPTPTNKIQVSLKQMQRKS